MINSMFWKNFQKIIANSLIFAIIFNGLPLSGESLNASAAGEVIENITLTIDRNTLTPGWTETPPGSGMWESNGASVAKNWICETLSAILSISDDISETNPAEISFDWMKNGCILRYKLIDINGIAGEGRIVSDYMYLSEKISIETPGFYTLAFIYQNDEFLSSLNYKCYVKDVKLKKFRYVDDCALQ